MSGLLGGVLPAIFSQADRAKRYIGGLLADPVGRMQQAGGQAVDDLSKLGLLSEQAFNDPRNPMKLQDNAAARQLTDTYLNSVLNFAPVGMHVWHGSPHKFDRFDSSKIGTGEGAQAYGHGLYFAESPIVAKEYQSALSNKAGEVLIDGQKVAPSNYEVTQLIARHSDEPAQLMQHLSDYVSRNVGNPYADISSANKALAALSSRKVVRPAGAGSLYKVDLPDDAIAKMLDWDKPLSQQAPEVRMLAKDLGISDQEVGAKFYQALTNQARDGAIARGQNAGTTLGASQAAASDDLRAFGIPGIRYLDGGSRGTGAGTSNFVVFPGNEGLLSILERNGQPLR